MTDNHSPGSAGKPSIGEKAYRSAEPLSDQGRRWRKHFLHAGPTLWALVADHDHIARLDLLIQDRSQAFGFRIEHACRAGDRCLFQPRDLGDAAFGRKVALQDRKMTLLINRIRPRTDHLLFLPRL